MNDIKKSLCGSHETQAPTGLIETLLRWTSNIRHSHEQNGGSRAWRRARSTSRRSNSCHEKGFYWQEGGWGIVRTHQMGTWRSTAGPTVPRRFQKQDTKSKGQNMSRKEKIWQRPCLHCQSAVRGRRSCDVHRGAGQWTLTCVWGTPTLQKTPTHTDRRPSKTQIMRHVNDIWKNLKYQFGLIWTETLSAYNASLVQQRKSRINQICSWWGKSQCLFVGFVNAT